MSKKTLMLSHPVEHLEMYELDPAKWDFDRQPPLFLVLGDTTTPYMPFFLGIGIKFIGEACCTENGTAKYFYALTEKVDAIWQQFFQKYYPHGDVTFHGNQLILSCAPKNHEDFERLIISHAIHAATREYNAERSTLIDLVFENQMDQKRREHWESHILAVRGEYHHGRRAEVAHARETGGVVGQAVQNFNWKFRQELEVNFGWWQHVLDAPTIQKHRNLFEQDFLCA